ncbi:DUF2946 family protein [Dyella sp. Tek66A03]|uniref:DUF2946 family protein n=1 Tax=Dyella sp. Tek66A03 TaxID=3458298 RepID=UPI00403E5CF9
MAGDAGHAAYCRDASHFAKHADNGPAVRPGRRLPLPCGGNQAPAVSPDGPAASTERCGYCVLLDHNSLLVSGKVLHLLPLAPSPGVPILAMADDAYASPILSAHPRGPPLIG